jgi:hypothetical protein
MRLPAHEPACIPLRPLRLPRYRLWERSGDREPCGAEEEQRRSERVKGAGWVTEQVGADGVELCEMCIALGEGICILSEQMGFLRVKEIGGGRGDAGYAAPVEEGVFYGEGGDGGAGVGEMRLGEGEGGGEGAAEIFAVDGYGAVGPVRGLLEEVFEDPVVGVEGVVDGVGEEVVGRPAGIDLDDRVG